MDPEIVRSLRFAALGLAFAAAACAKSSSSANPPSDSASAAPSAAAPTTWLENARAIWGSGDEAADMNLSSMGRDASPGDVVRKTATLTGRFSETGDALPPALADRILRTMRFPGAPPAVLFRLFRDDITPDAAMGTIAIVSDPAAPIDWAKTQPKDLGKLLPELARPSLAKTSFALTRSFAHSWRAWSTSYDFHWDGKPVDEAAAIAMCERAASLDMVPGGTMPPADKRKDCAVPKMAPSTITWSCFYSWEEKKETYDCKVEPGQAPAISIRPR